MIKVIDDWYVTVMTNPTNYVVRRGNGEKDKKGWKDDAIGYFGSLKNAIKFIRGEIVAEKLKGDFPAVSAALRAVSEVDVRFEKIMESVTV